MHNFLTVVNRKPKLYYLDITTEYGIKGAWRRGITRWTLLSTIDEIK